MKKISAALGLVILLTGGEPSVAKGSFYTGNQLYAICQTDENFCTGYMGGAADAMMARDMFCVPDGVVSSQVRDIIKQYLEAHPEARQYSAASISYSALVAAWPCSKKGKNK